MASISTTSFYGARARAQHERQHIPPREINLNGSDAESEVDEDELEVFEQEEREESDYRSETESEDDADSGEENTVQSNVSGTSGAKGTSKGNQPLPWRRRGTVQYNTTYKGEPFPLQPGPEMTPFQYFKQMFDDQLIDHIVEQTNLYSVQSTGTSIAVDHNEIEQYIGLLVMMSIIKLPQIRMYWAKETRIPCIADVMSINRFKKIKQFFHCNDNEKNLPPTDDNFDKLYKVRPVIDSLLEKCKQIPQEEHHSVSSTQKKHMPLISFQSAIAASLCQAGKTSAGAVRSCGRPSSSSPTPVDMPGSKKKSSSMPNPVEDVRLDQYGHFPVYEEKQQRCRLCKTGYSHLKCCKCQVHLCLVKPQNCFNSFHGL